MKAVDKAVNDAMDGWAGLDIDDGKIKETLAEHEQKAREIASRYHRVFVQNADGAQILKDMIRTTMFRATVLPDDTQFGAGIKAGREDLVLQIMQNIEIAERE